MYFTNITKKYNYGRKKKAAELKSYYWTENANICEESIEFDESGYIRNTIVGIVEQNGIPVEKEDIRL